MAGAFNYETTNYPCPRGYRIPNHRELMLLYTTWSGYVEIKKYGKAYMCKTSFGYNDIPPYSNNRFGFTYEGTTCTLSKATRGFLCVRYATGLRGLMTDPKIENPYDKLLSIIRV
ncbi:hypothetical protein ACIXKS_01245 [Bacteroides fragilis]|uniref:hypothetical protein n=1 Tax=Bacteroidaceae TaxID=815 RepID=UPI00321AE93B